MKRSLLCPEIDGAFDPHWQAWRQASDPGAVKFDQGDRVNPGPEAREVPVLRPQRAVFRVPTAVLACGAPYAEGMAPRDRRAKRTEGRVRPACSRRFATSCPAAFA